MEERDGGPGSPRGFNIVGLNYMSFYLVEHQEAIAFYTRVYGPPENADSKQNIYGWRMGSTWLTLFPSKIGTHAESNPRNAEFAIEVSAPNEVDLLYRALMDAGARSCWEPEDTTMYEPMRFACVDDPFGIRIDIYCPL